MRRSPPVEMIDEPDGTAVLVALWRAAHLEVDDPPPVLEDHLALELAAPPADFRREPWMAESFCGRMRGTMVGRARFVEDLVADEMRRGVRQYVMLGAGLDTFALRHRRPRTELVVFEVDEPRTQAWKRRRMAELRWTVPEHLSFVPVDFETGQSWVQAVTSAGFDPAAPAVISSLGVTMYLTLPAITAMLAEVAALAPGTVFVCGFAVPAYALDQTEIANVDLVREVAAGRGCPWLSHFTAGEFTALAKDAGFADATVVDAADLERRYFAGRTDGLRPSTVESYLVATTG